MSQPGSDVQARPSCNGPAVVARPDQSSGAPAHTPARLCKPRGVRRGFGGGSRCSDSERRATGRGEQR